jgi:ATP-dependent DNA ligase
MIAVLVAERTSGVRSPTETAITDRCSRARSSAAPQLDVNPGSSRRPRPGDQSDLGGGQRDPDEGKPMIARPAAKIPTGERWWYEPRFDGSRCLAFRPETGRVQLRSRRQRSLATAFPEIVELAAARAPPGTVVDGELVALVEGRADHAYLPRRRHWTKARVRMTYEAVVGGVSGPLARPRGLILGRYAETGRLRVVGRTGPLSREAAAELVGLLRPPRQGHPWAEALPGGRFGLPGGELVEYTLAGLERLTRCRFGSCYALAMRR